MTIAKSSVRVSNNSPGDQEAVDQSMALCGGAERVWEEGDESMWVVEERGAKRMTPRFLLAEGTKRGTPMMKGDEKMKQVLKVVQSGVG